MTKSIHTESKISGYIAALLTAVLVFMLTMLPFAADVNAVDELPNENPMPSGVAGGAFEVRDYSMKAVVNKNHSYDVEENITVYIPDKLQSVEFAVPSGNFRISGLEVEDTDYSSNTASEASTVTIIDQDKLDTGIHTYVIRYRISEFADRNESYDIFYFNVLLPEWKQPIARVNINVSFPDDFPWDDMQCYAGQFGVQDVTNRISFDADESSKTVTITGSKIPENFGITLKAELANGYWEGALDGIWAVYAMIAVLGGVAFILLVLWFIGGRDPKVKKEAVTRPDPGVAPYEVGYIFNSEVTIGDIVMLILGLAIHGYLSIIEYEPKRYRLRRLNEPAGEEKHVRNAFGILFEDIPKERDLEMKDLGGRLDKIKDAISDDIASGFSYKDRLAFTPLSRAFRIAGAVFIGIGLGVTNALRYLYAYLSVNYIESIAVAVIAGFSVFMLCRAIDVRDSSSYRVSRWGELIYGAGILIAASYVAIGVWRSTGEAWAACLVIPITALSVFLAVIMRARGRENAELVSKFRQLRNFIYHPTPKELLDNYLQDSNYYYEMMPYALVFGAEEAWAISFLTLDVPEPAWYSDEIEGHAFTNIRDNVTTIDYARDMRSFVRTIETAYSDMHRHPHRR